MREGQLRRWAPALALVPLVAVAVAARILDSTPYSRLSRSFPGLDTAESSSLLHAVVAVASTVCVGALFYAAFVRTRTGGGRLEADGTVDYAIVRWSSAVWCAAAILLIGVDGADASGQSIGRLMTPGAIGYLVQASYLPGAWIVVAIVSCFIFVAANIARAWPSLAGLFALSATTVLAPIVVTQVLVGPNHDFGSDAAIIGAPAEAAWFGATVIVAWRVWGRPRPSLLALRRYRAAAAVCWGVVTATQLVTFFFEMGGTSPFASVTGWLFFTQFAILIALALVGLPALRHRADPDSPRLLTRAPVLLTTLALMSAYVAVDVIRSRIPPPVYFVRTSIEQLYFGYNVDRWPSALVLAFDWRPSILFITMALVASGLYLLAVRRVRRRGERWPIGRTASWLGGWLVVVLITSSGLGKYASASFSMHMVLHMCLNMLAPVLFVLGGAITLFLQAVPPKPEAQSAGVHEWLEGLLNWKVSRAAYNPLIVFIDFVGTYFLLYFTGLFMQALRFHWAHQVMNIEFLIGGYMFYGLVLGTDRTPRTLPPIGRLAIVLAAMPFHAFFGVLVTTSNTIIAKLFYEYVGAHWMTNLRADQNLGGAIAWGAGELPLIFAVVVLVIQWRRQDTTAAVGHPAGPDDGSDAYAEMLAALGDERRHAPREEASR